MFFSQLVHLTFPLLLWYVNYNRILSKPRFQNQIPFSKLVRKSFDAAGQLSLHDTDTYLALL